MLAGAWTGVLAGAAIGFCVAYGCDLLGEVPDLSFALIATSGLSNFNIHRFVARGVSVGDIRRKNLLPIGPYSEHFLLEILVFLA